MYLLSQEEREAADARLMKLKLQAKAKVASLNKRIEELTEKGSPLPAHTLSEEQVCPQVGRAGLLKDVGLSMMRAPWKAVF